MYDDLIGYFSSQRNLARAISVSRGAVSKWLSEYSIPAQRLIEIEIITNGRFKAKDLHNFQQSQRPSVGKNSYRLPTDYEVASAIAQNSSPNDVHQHPDCVRAAFAFLDAQTKTKNPRNGVAPLKHLIEDWCGRYVSAADVRIAAKLHPDVYGEYADYNISTLLVFPCYQRLNGLVEPFTGGCGPSDFSAYTTIECPEQGVPRELGAVPEDFIRGDA